MEEKANKMSAEKDREISESSKGNDKEDTSTTVVNGPEEKDLTEGETPAQTLADDETRSPEEEGGGDPPV